MKLNEEDQKLWDRITRSVRSLHDPDHIYDESAKLQMIHVLDFDPVLDLHGLTVASAHNLANYHIQEAKASNIKKLRHITGKSGQISKEYSDWMKQNQYVKRIEKLNDGGAWNLWLE